MSNEIIFCFCFKIKIIYRWFFTYEIDTQCFKNGFSKMRMVMISLSGRSDLRSRSRSWQHAGEAHACGPQYNSSLSGFSSLCMNGEAWGSEFDLPFFSFPYFFLKLNINRCIILFRLVAHYYSGPALDLGRDFPYLGREQVDADAGLPVSRHFSTQRHSFWASNPLFGLAFLVLNFLLSFCFPCYHLVGP